MNRKIEEGLQEVSSHLDGCNAAEAVRHFMNIVINTMAMMNPHADQYLDICIQKEIEALKIKNRKMIADMLSSGPKVVPLTEPEAKPEDDSAKV